MTGMHESVGQMDRLTYILITRILVGRKYTTLLAGGWPTRRST